MSVGPWATWVSLGKLPEISIGAPSVRVSSPGIPCPGPEWQMEVTVTFDQMGLSCIFYMILRHFLVCGPYQVVDQLLYPGWHGYGFFNPCFARKNGTMKIHEDPWKSFSRPHGSHGMSASASYGAPRAGHRTHRTGSFFCKSPKK